MEVINNQKKWRWLPPPLFTKKTLKMKEEIHINKSFLGQNVRIVMIENIVYYGWIINIDEEVIELKDKYNNFFNIHKKQIVSLEVVK